MQIDYQKKTPAEKKKFWEEQIRLWKESGLSQSEYCKRHGIRTNQWFYWRKRCQDTEASLTLVPLKIPSVNEPSHRVPAIRVITPNGFTIEIEGDASITSLPQLIREVVAI
jgi:hypothetical protein